MTPWPIRAHNPNCILTGPAIFAQLTDHRVSLLYNGLPLCPSKLPPPMGGSGSPSNTWFLGPTRVLSQNGILIGQSVFAGLTSVTDRPTDHTTRSVTISRIYEHSTVTWSYNINNMIDSQVLYC